MLLLARLDLINIRLSEISDGLYKDIILKVDQRERPRRTVCTGANWNYKQQDILEIAEVVFNSDEFIFSYLI